MPYTLRVTDNKRNNMVDVANQYFDTIPYEVNIVNNKLVLNKKTNLKDNKCKSLIVIEKNSFIRREKRRCVDV